MTTEADIRDRFWKDLKASPFLMVALDNSPQHSLPMTAHFDEGTSGPLWIFTSRENRLVTGLQHGGSAMAQFVGKGHDLFACLHGVLTIDNNPATIDRFWSAKVATWYPDGRQDPSLTLLRLDVEDAEIWLADSSYSGLFTRIFGGDLRGEVAGKHAELTF